MNKIRPIGIISSRIFYPILLAMGDLAAFYGALWISFILRKRFLDHWIPLPLSQTFGDLALRVWMPTVLIVVFAYEGLYFKRKPFWEETRMVVRAIFLSFLAIFAIVSLGKLSGEISRAVVIGTGFLSLTFVPIVRSRWKPVLHRMGFGTKRAIMVGDNPVAHLAHLGLFRDHYLGIRLVGFVSLPEESLFSQADNEPGQSSISERRSGWLSCPEEQAGKLSCLGTIEDLPEISEQEFIRGAIVAVPHLRREYLAPLIERIQRSVLSVYVVPNVTQVSLLNSELLYLFYEEMFLLGIHNNLKSRLNRWGKTFFDVVVVFFLCITLLPLFAGLAILVRIASPGPVVFRQKRVGQKGEIFGIYKFRTMIDGAEQHLAKILESDPEKKKEFEEKQKLLDDPRITTIGKLLRRTSLDELPQIFNVLKGEMSLVGPRPVTEQEIISRYREAGEDYCLVKPGMTGLWQVSGRSENSYDFRVRLDLWYIRNWSLWLDIVILIRTIGVVLGRRGAI